MSNLTASPRRDINKAKDARFRTHGERSKVPEPNAIVVCRLAAAFVIAVSMQLMQ
jgi:hypothetical protein